MKTAVIVFVAMSAFAQDSAETLAQILAGKGAITAQEFASIQAAARDDRVHVLANILQQKGLLTSSDMARLGSPTPASNAGGSQLTPAPPATGPGPAQSAPPPVIAESHFPVTLYGTLLLNSVYNTAQMNITDIPLYVVKPDDLGDDRTFAMTARQTRLGLRYENPSEVVGARLSGLAEVDFFGGKAPFSNGVNFDLVRMRLAFGRLDWKHVSLEGGQDWSIFAPLNPTSLAEYAVPSMSASGNPWIRLPQIRGEAHGSIGNGLNLLAQFAAIDPNMGDYSTTTFSGTRAPGVGERGRAPGADARIALTAKQDDRDFTVGFSGHYIHGKNSGTVGNITEQLRVNSWGAALDYTLPFSKLFNLTGEIYTGRELGIFSVTSGEAIEPVGIPGDRGVRDSGGWVQAQFNFTSKWQVNLVYGIDDPIVREILVGARTRNESYMGNVMYKYTPHTTVAWEYRRINTSYRDQPNLRGDTLNLALDYTF